VCSWMVERLSRVEGGKLKLYSPRRSDPPHSQGSRLENVLFLWKPAQLTHLFASCLPRCLLKLTAFALRASLEPRLHRVWFCFLRNRTFLTLNQQDQKPNNREQSSLGIELFFFTRFSTTRFLRRDFTLFFLPPWLTIRTACQLRPMRRKKIIPKRLHLVRIMKFHRHALDVPSRS